MPRLALGSTHPPIQWVLQVLSLGVKQLVHKSDYSLACSAKFKNEWCHTHSSTYPLHMHMGSFCTSIQKGNNKQNITFGILISGKATWQMCPTAYKCVPHLTTAAHILHLHFIKTKNYSSLSFHFYRMKLLVVADTCTKYFPA